MDSIAGLFGSQSSSQNSSSGSSSSGYGALPAFDQQALQSLVENAQSTLGGANGTNIYTPLALTSQEQTAQNLSQPMTQQGVQDLTNNYLNPYTNDLMQAIQQNASGANSLYQQQVAGSGFAAGTTNRDFLNEGYAQGQENLGIGQALAGEYNDALTEGLGQQNADVSQLMGEGANQRQIYAGTQQAPVSALQSLASLLGVVPATSESTNSSSGSAQSTNNSNGSFGQALGTVADIASFFAP